MREKTKKLLANTVVILITVAILVFHFTGLAGALPLLFWISSGAILVLSIIVQIVVGNIIDRKYENTRLKTFVQEALFSAIAVIPQVILVAIFYSVEK